MTQIAACAFACPPTSKFCRHTPRMASVATTERRSSTALACFSGQDGYGGRVYTSSASIKKSKAQSLLEMEMSSMGMGSLKHGDDESDELRVAMVREIATAASERAEMHRIVGEQRDGWNKMLLDAFNCMSVAALSLSATAIANTHSHSSPALLCCSILYCGAAIVSGVMNTIQPSQLAEEQRSACRLFLNLREDILSWLSTPPHLRQYGSDYNSYVTWASSAVLALDKAYPLPLIPGMLDKFPAVVEPTNWWESGYEEHEKEIDSNDNGKGWDAEMEEEMRRVGEVVEMYDMREFVKLSKIVLRANKALAVGSGVLAGIAAIASIVSSTRGGHASELAMAMVCSALGMVGNAFGHGGQMGMVFEIYRNSAGYYKFLNSSLIQGALSLPSRLRPHSKLFRLRLALHLGRPNTTPILPPLSPSPSSPFAGKLF